MTRDNLDGHDSAFLTRYNSVELDERPVRQRDSCMAIATACVSFCNVAMHVITLAILASIIIQLNVMQEEVHRIEGAVCSWVKCV